MRLPKTLGLVSALALMVGGASAVADDQDRDDFRTATPIKHVVIIFQENISFDHYFGTYPNALNLAGETPFVAKKHTPTANNLVHPLNVNNNFVPLTGVDLLNNNPNNNPNLPVGRTATNSTVASNPFRLSPAQALTDDQNHADTPEQTAYDNGKVDGFPAFAGSAGPLGTKAQVMGYFDGNTVTALWNYAQHFALNDNSYSSQFGPSTPGALNLISGQSNGVIASTAKNVLDGSGNLLNPGHIAFGDNTHSPSNLTVIGDLDPLGDLCSTGKDQTQLAGRNFGDLLNDKGITWGSFMGGFDLTVVNPDGSTGCARHHNPTAPGTPEFTSLDFVPHHAPFQYYASTSNPTHARPSSVQAIGHSLIPHTNTPEPANHNYDINDFFAALNAHNLPAVSFLKAPAFQDGHPGNSDPLDEQTFVVGVLNALQSNREWSETAVFILYDDSDGWYDHQMPPIVNPSLNPTIDALNAPGVCNTSNGFQQGRPLATTPLNGNFGQSAFGRCGYGTRQPLLAISPFAKRNFIDHSVTDQSSVLRFIEDNWLDGARIQLGGSFDTIAGSLNNMFDFDRRDEDGPPKLILNPANGTIVSASGFGDDDDDRDHDHDRR